MMDALPEPGNLIINIEPLKNELFKKHAVAVQCYG